MQNIFDPKKINIWEIFANEHSGKFIEGESWHSDRAEINYSEFKIIFDNYTLWSGKYSQEFTRVVVPFISRNNFTFEIYRNDILSSIEKIFGAQDIKIDIKEFDDLFIIKSNNELKVKSLLQNKKIRELIQKQIEGNLEISQHNSIWKPMLPKNEYQLLYYQEGKIADIEKLKSLLNLFIELIFELQKQKLIFPKTNN
ncbi:hypothetical protein [Flavobacterium aquicola]|uniref:DUF3137 domain-containing protein n=1 Tax=Flavobacterium aquicola TaxID=1682742 RepID=A0A3E0EWW2_9FLAO|nr:hypothetical protein [Flavobacterium aquicola]REH01647.1 hypothetical protein C8P67_101126 [Flavobacterium aquicola]